MASNVKCRTDDEIRQAADQFRGSVGGSGRDLPPIDAIYIAGVVLRLDIIPLPSLFADQHIDAALLPDLTGFYIDEDAYLQGEAGAGWVERRLRFSFAHELGHLTLHREEIAARQFKTVDDFRRWAATGPEYNSADYQADEFAGRFLVPREILVEEYDRHRQRAEGGGPDWREIEGMREHLASKIAPRFGVNRQVIEVRLDREGIWPAG